MVASGQGTPGKEGQLSGGDAFNGSREDSRNVARDIASHNVQSKISSLTPKAKKVLDYMATHHTLNKYFFDFQKLPGIKMNRQKTGLSKASHDVFAELVDNGLIQQTAFRTGDPSFGSSRPTFRVNSDALMVYNKTK